MNSSLPYLLASEGKCLGHTSTPFAHTPAQPIPTHPHTKTWYTNINTHKHLICKHTASTNMLHTKKVSTKFQPYDFLSANLYYDVCCP